MSKSTLILADLHDKITIAQKILDNNPCDKIIFLGDYFDSFEGDTIEAIETAKWVVKTMEVLGDRALWCCGNHDVPYRYPNIVHYRCSGWTPKKCEEINKILGSEHWNKMKLCHFYQNYLFSHAGISDRVFGRGLDNVVEVEDVINVCESALLSARFGKPSMQMMAGKSRGGSQNFGGVTWLDISEFQPIKSLGQVFGHSPRKAPELIQGEDSINWCLDTHLKYYTILEDGVFTHHLTEDLIA